MQVINIFVNPDWLRENTKRTTVRDDISAKDRLVTVAKGAEATLAISIAAAGLGRGLLPQALALNKFGLTTARQLPNGTGYCGTNPDCAFKTPINVTKQKKIQQTALEFPETPYVALHLVTDQEELDAGEIERGILFFSESEADKFIANFESLDDFTHSRFYKQPPVPPLRISETDFPMFASEFEKYCNEQKNFFSKIINTPEPDDVTIYRLTDNQNNAHTHAGDQLLEIHLPAYVSPEDFQNHFKQTIQNIQKPPHDKMEKETSDKPKEKTDSTTSFREELSHIKSRDQNQHPDVNAPQDETADDSTKPPKPGSGAH